VINFQTVDVGTDVDQLAESLESIQVTWVTGSAAIAVLIAGVLLARLARRSIRALGDRTELGSPQLFTLASRIAFYSIVFYSLGAALGFLGFEVIPLLSMLGLATVVLVLGLRPFFENFAAGITLQTRRPFDPGDQVLLGEHEGTVRDVNARTVVVESMGGELVHIPNRMVLDEPIVNYTAVATRRSILEVGLAYGSDLERAEEVLRTAVQATAGVVANPPVQVFVHTFDNSTINAAVWFWHEPQIPTAWSVRHQAAVDLKRALDEAGITIAFPQRVLWWGEQDPGESRPALG
jgi:small-conductance mechanosensitive channel